jgi:hypothetical protein
VSNALGIGPAVMINRIVHQAATPGNHLVQVAKVRTDLANAVQDEQAKTQLLTGEAAKTPVTTGADVDRLV